MVKLHWLLIFPWVGIGMFNAQGFFLPQSSSLILSLCFLFTWETSGLLSCLLMLTMGRWRRRTQFTAELSFDEDKNNWRDIKTLWDRLKRTRPYALEVVLISIDVFEAATATPFRADACSLKWGDGEKNVIHLSYKCHTNQPAWYKKKIRTWRIPFPQYYKWVDC